MNPFVRSCCACFIGVFLLAFATRLPAPPVMSPVQFSVVTNTSLGQSVFVVGSLPQLGNWSATGAVKLVPGSCAGSNCTWSVKLGLPEGTAFEYKFVRRNDCAPCLGDAANIVWEPGANRTGSTTNGPAAPFAGKSVFYVSGWTNPSVLFSNWSTGWTSKVMTAFANGRSPGEKIWRADGLNVPGQSNMLFVFSDNNGRFDNAYGVAGQNYDTPLDAFVVQDGQIYNYWPAPVIGAPRVETFSITPTNGLQTRTVRVYLPRGFTNNLTKRYPVLYMNDGQNLFLGQGNFGGWNADTNATHLTRFGRMRETIIVGIDNTSDRQCEYTPCSICAPSSISAYVYADFLVNQLKPFIDTQYPSTAGRTLTDPENTGIVGSSRGGLCAVFVGWERPDVFRRIGGLSPSFWACADTVNSLLTYSKRPARIYLDSGSVGDFPTTTPVCNPCYDGLAQTLTARDNLLKNGFTLNVDLYHAISHGDQHNELFWNRRLPACYQFLFPTTDEPNSLLQTVAPLRVNEVRWTNNFFTFNWPAFQARMYSVLGSTNLDRPLSNWHTLYTSPLETRPWNTLTAPPTNRFQFFRVLQHPTPGWPD